MKTSIRTSILFSKSLIAIVCFLFGLILPGSVVAVDVWQIVGTAGFSAGQADYTSLAFDGSTPYVAYMDVGNGQKATVMRLPSYPTPVPTLNEWGLIILSVLLAGICYITIRRRNSASI